ncbi:MAG: TlpA family protein disulfide reductase [Candidatus Harrisonbacteria bacterium]|nr:TlpA family protein disulfide reductase [Candidatus Harrisonbacteria bacterium]
MNTKIVISITVFILIIGGFLLLKQKDVSEPTSSANNFFDLQLHDYNGNIISLADFRGKPLVINSWAAWCPFCKKELVDFATAQKEFKDRVVIIAIDRAESLAVAQKYSDELGVTNDMVFLLDPGDSFYQSIGGFSMPETIFVDKNGNIVIHKRGPMEVQEIREKIQQLIFQ